MAPRPGSRVKTIVPPFHSTPSLFLNRQRHTVAHRITDAHLACTIAGSAEGRWAVRRYTRGRRGVIGPAIRQPGSRDRAIGENAADGRAGSYGAPWPTCRSPKVEGTSRGTRHTCEKAGTGLLSHAAQNQAASRVVSDRPLVDNTSHSDTWAVRATGCAGWSPAISSGP